MVGWGKLRFSILSLIILVGVLGFASAETLTVNQTGYNNSLGNYVISSNPIQDAISDSTTHSGDVIEVYSGTYAPFNMKYKTNLTIKAIEGQTPNIVGTSENVPSNRRIINIDGDNTKIIGLTIIGNGDKNLYTGFVGISIPNKNATIKDNIIKNLLTGIQTATAPNEGNNQILNNNISNAQVGISLQNDYNIVKNNIINAEGEGFGLASFNTTFENNQITVGTNGYEVKISSGAEPYFGSIKDGIDAVNEGQRVYVHAGTHNENVVINKGINLVGENKNLAILNGHIIISSDNVILSNFKILPGTLSGDNGEKAAVQVSASNIIIEDLIIENILGAGKSIEAIYLTSASLKKNITIKNNIIGGVYNTERGSNGIIIQGVVEDVLVSGNVIKNIHANNILYQYGWAHAIEVTPTCNSLIVPKNIVIKNNSISEVTSTTGDAFGFTIDWCNSTNIANASEVIFKNNYLDEVKVRNLDIENILDVKNNYWGSNNPNFSNLIIDSSIVSSWGDIDYSPWITQSSESITTEENVPTEVNTTGTNATINLTTLTSQTGTVTVQQYSEDPHGGFSVGEKSSLGKYIEINSEIHNDNITEVEIRIYYTEEELHNSGIAESSLKLYWYNETSGSWEVIENSGVNMAENYVWGITNHFSTYTLGGVGGPDVIINSLVCLTGYTNNPTNIFYGYAYDSSNNVLNILYNRSDRAETSNPVYDTPINSNNVSFHTQPNDPVFPEGNNSIFIWGISNQTGPTTVCEFFVDKNAPSQVTNVQSNNYFGCVENYVNVAPNFTWTPATDIDGSGINHYEVEVYNSTSSNLIYSDNTTSTNMNVNNLVNGTGYYIKVRAWDNAENYGEWSDNSPTVFYDAVKPSVMINSPAQGSYFNNNFLIIETDSDNLGLYSCKYRVTNNAVPTLGYTEINCSVPLEIDIFSYCPTDGTCRIYKNVTDKACNTNEISRYFYIDRTAPLLSVLSPTNYFNSSEVNLEINYTVNDAGVKGESCWYTDTELSNVSLTNCANITNTIWSEGNHNVTIYANDSLGNLNSTSVYFTIDLTAPEITINSPLNQSYNSTVTIFNVTAIDDKFEISSCRYSLDGASNITMTNSGNYWNATNSSMTDDSHTVIFYCNDSLGNINSSSRTFRVDTTAPTILRIAKPNNDGNEITDNISRCDQSLVVEIMEDVSGLNESSVYAELRNSEEVIREITLSKATNQDGTLGGKIFEGTMDLQIPAGDYNLVVYSSDNLGNKGNKTLIENIEEGIYVEYLDPVSCVVNAGQTKTCQFTFNVCARNITNIDFNMTGLGENPMVVTPYDLNATISKENNFAYVGLYEVSEGNPRYLNLNNGEKVNGKTTFNLSIAFTPNVTSMLGAGDYDLNYNVNGYNI